MTLLNSMEIFHSVAIHHSFTKAALELKLSKSFVSVQISTLETQLKIKLLNRTTRHLSLTLAGENFLESCKKIIAEKNTALHAIESLKNEPSGHLKISAPPSMCASYLALLIPKFIAVYPKITVELDSSVALKNLLRDKIDIAIRMTRKPDPNYIARLLGEFKLIVCATPEHLSQYGSPKRPQDLINHNCLIYSTAPEGFLWEFYKDQQREEIPVTGTIISDNSFTIQLAMLAHCGIARLPSYLLHQNIHDKKLTLLLEDYNKNTLPIYALYASQPTAKIKDYFSENTL
jgi:LysR family transcriptional regulator for bpeEF and oprC